MLKNILILAILLVTNLFLFGQQPFLEDYKVYASLIKTEILDTTNSIVIIKKGIKTKETIDNTYRIANNLNSKDLNSQYEIYGWTENSKKERPSVIDSISRQFIIDYCNRKYDEFILTNQFNQTYKTVLIKKFPIKKKSVIRDWKNFYSEYPGSGGIFSFSRIFYYLPDKRIAIFYYWHRRNGLNGQGALAVMIKSNSIWQLKYKIYLWSN